MKTKVLVILILLLLIGEILYAQQYTFHGEVYYTDNGLYNLDGTLKADLSPPVTVELWDYDEGGNPPSEVRRTDKCNKKL